MSNILKNPIPQHYEETNQTDARNAAVLIKSCTEVRKKVLEKKAIAFLV